VWWLAHMTHNMEVPGSMLGRAHMTHNMEVPGSMLGRAQHVCAKSLAAIHLTCSRSTPLVTKVERVRTPVLLSTKLCIPAIKPKLSFLFSD